MRKRLCAILGCGLVLACAGDDSRDAPAADRTQAERDSLLGESSLPGAGVVNRARESANTARERAAQYDSIQSR
jgi:hypothetical protein